MYGSHTLRARHYASKPERIEGVTLSNNPTTKISNGTSNTNTNSKNKSNCNPSQKSSSIKPASIETSIASSTPSHVKISSPISPISPLKSHKHHKKKRGKNNRDKLTHAPLLIFPYSWNSGVKDSKCLHNKQFHKKSKPMPARITIQHGIDHLLSPSKCSKRYLSAYCLNLHQLTTCEKLLECMIKKLTPVIKQLHHITNAAHANEANKQTNHTTNPTNHNTNHTGTHNIISPSISPTDTSQNIAFAKYSLNENLTVTVPSCESQFNSPFNSPQIYHNNNNNNKQYNGNGNMKDIIELNEDSNINTSPIPLSQSKTSATISLMDLKVMNKTNKATNYIAYSLPTQDANNMSNTIVIPQSNLDLVETRSCPDLDTEYNNISDENPSTPPSSTGCTQPSMSLMSCSLSSSKSTPLLFNKIQLQVQQKEIKKEEKKSQPDHMMMNSNKKTKDYKSKMKAYCIATIKHNIDIIYHWIYYYPSDFADSVLLDRLLTYINKVRNHSAHSSIQRRWNKLLQLMTHRKPEMKYSSILSSSISNLRIIPRVRKHERKTSFQFTDSFFPPREMVSKLGGSVDLLHIHPALVADQLTLIDTEIFLQIGAREFTNQAWQNRPAMDELPCNDENMDEFSRRLYDKLHGQKIDAPNLLYMIDHVNRLSLWVATEILSRNTTAEMADLTKYFYVVAHRCLELCNIHTCTAIFGGICLQPLTRLRRLNRYLSDDQQIQQLHHALSEMVSSNSNYKTYRNWMEQWYSTHANTPCIPFIPVVMKDLFQIQLNLTCLKKDDDDESKQGKELKCLDLGLLEKNCRHIRRVYETQQKAKLYANQLPADTDIQSKLRMNIAKFETHETLRSWSADIQPKLTKEDKENLEMIDTLEEFGFL